MMSPGLVAVPPGMFSVAGTQATRLTGRPELGDRGDGLEHRGAAGHVHLHLLHLRRGLDRDPAGVEGDRLADEAERLAGRLRRLVAQHDQPAAPRALPLATAAARPSRSSSISARPRTSARDRLVGGGDLASPIGR